MLLLEQPADVDNKGRTVAETSWRSRWKALHPTVNSLKLLLPLLLIYWLVLLEIVAFNLWLRDGVFSLAGVLHLLTAAAFPVVVFVVALELLLLAQCVQPARRTLRLEKDRIKLSQTKYDRVPWRQVRRWLLAPVPERQDLITLTLERGDDPKRFRRYWSIVLDEREQKRAFLTELGHLQQMEHSRAPVVELSQPMPERKAALRGAWLMPVAIFLFIHGWPPLVFGLMPYHLDDAHGPPSRFAAIEEKEIEHIMRRVVDRLHISNEKQFRRVFWIPGALLTVAGGGLYVWGMIRRIRQMTELNQLYDLELAKITLPPLEPSSSRSHGALP